MPEHEEPNRRKLDLSSELGVSRRDLLRRGAVVGGTLLWAAPLIQSIRTPAYAAVCSDCHACCCCSKKAFNVGTPFAAFCAEDGFSVDECNAACTAAGGTRVSFCRGCDSAVGNGTTKTCSCTGAAC